MYFIFIYSIFYGEKILPPLNTNNLVVEINKVGYREHNKTVFSEIKTLQHFIRHDNGLSSRFTLSAVTGELAAFF